MHYTSSSIGQFGQDVIHLSECMSTNDYAKAEIRKDKLQNGHVIVSDFQSGGRGRSGNKWESEPGKNLLLSLVLFPVNLKVEDQYLLNMLSSLAIVKTLRFFLGNQPLRVKWPNDVYFGDKKIAGILIENFISGQSIDQCIIGIGLNVNQDYFLTENATSMHQITKGNFELNTVLHKLLEIIELEYMLLINNNIDYIRKAYNSILYWKDEERFFETKTKWKGFLRGTDSSGRLIIEREGVRELFSQNEIKFLR